MLPKLLNFSSSFHYLLLCNRSMSTCKTTIILSSLTPLGVNCVQLYGSGLEAGAGIISETFCVTCLVIDFQSQLRLSWPLHVISQFFKILIILLSTMDYWSTIRESQIKERGYRFHFILYQFFEFHTMCFDDTHLPPPATLPLPSQLCQFLN